MFVCSTATRAKMGAMWHTSPPPPAPFFVSVSVSLSLSVSLSTCAPLPPLDLVCDGSSPAPVLCRFRPANPDVEDAKAQILLLEPQELA